MACCFVLAGPNSTACNQSQRITGNNALETNQSVHYIHYKHKPYTHNYYQY